MGDVSRQVAVDSTGVPSQNIVWRLKSQERRIDMLESIIAQKPLSKSSSGDSDFDSLQVLEPEFEEEMMFRGKGFKTQFWGSTCPLSALSGVSESSTL